MTIAVDQETIVEDDIEEGEGKDAVFTLTRAGDASEELTVKVRVDDPEMIRCFDHLFWRSLCDNSPTFEEEVTFAEDSATATLAVKIYNDWRDVPDGAAVTATLIDENGYRPGDPDSAGVTLVDNDFASHLTLSDDAEVAEGEDGTGSPYGAGTWRATSMLTGSTSPGRLPTPGRGDPTRPM